MADAAAAALRRAVPKICCAQVIFSACAVFAPSLGGCAACCSVLDELAAQHMCIMRRASDCRHGIPVAAVTAMLSLPGFVVKQVVNIFQLKASMQALVAYDKRRDNENDRRSHVD